MRALLACLLCLASPASAEVYRVGPGEAHTQLAGNRKLERELLPGDVVEIVGGQTYTGDTILRSHGAPGNPIVFRGIPVDGKRPVIAGGDFTVVVDGDHVVLEGIEVTGGNELCVSHRGDDLVLRGVVVHDCPQHGILSHDDEAGSLLIEYSEIYRSGSGLYKHQLYLTANSVLYPDAVFRLQHSYIHDGLGGNNVKSRARRNEIYYNWIEGPLYHVLDLIGPDNGQGFGPPQEDSDVVGNVLWQKGEEGAVARMGGDGTGATGGCYRFAWNTILTTGPAGEVFRTQDEIGSVALFANVVAGNAGGTLVGTGGDWVHGGVQVVGADNWIVDGWTIPAGFDETTRGTDPGVEDLAAADLRPVTGSPLVDAAAGDTLGPSACRVSNPLVTPAFLPPPRRLEAVGSAQPRTASGGSFDIGAFELGQGDEPGPGDPPPNDGGGGCQIAGRTGRGGWWILALLALAVRRRTRPE